MNGVNFWEVQCEQGSPEWHRARAGCLTASQFYTLITGGVAAKNKLLYKLEAEHNNRDLGPPPPSFTGEAMQWGKDHEPMARGNYCFDVAQVEEVGFLLHCHYPRVGCSPDGVYRKNLMAINHGLEIKCPFNPEVHVKHIQGLISPNYYWQIQFSMWLTGAEFWDFMSFDPRRETQKTYYKRFMRNDLEMKKVEEVVWEFCNLRDSMQSYKEKSTPAEMLMSRTAPKFF